MAAAQTLVFASTVPGPGSASVPANVLGQEDPAMGSKTRIGSSDDAEKSAVAPPPSVPVTNQPSSTATTAPIPRATAVWWQNDAVLRARIDAGSGDALGLVWIKNKGYPWWPARRVPTEYLQMVPEKCKKPKQKNGETTCEAYLYFGTLEYQWIVNGCQRYPMVSFREGWQVGHWAFSKRKPLMGGIGQACELLIAPDTQIPGFFDYVEPAEPETPDAVEKTTSITDSTQHKSQVQNAERAAKKKAKRAAAGLKKKALKTKELLTKKAHATKDDAKKLSHKVKKEQTTVGVGTKRVGEPHDEAPPAKRTPQPDVKWPSLAALTDFPKSSSFTPPGYAKFELPFHLRKEGKPPFYKTLQRCQWVCQRPPRRFPRDEVEQCLCVPTDAMRVAMFDLREAEKVLAASKKAVKGDGVGVVAGAGAVAGDTAEAREKEPSKETREPKTDIAKTGCGPGCFNRASFTTCDSRVCPCGSACGNLPFHLLSSPKSKTLLTESRGWGLFAAEKVPAGSFVIEYVGEIIDDKTTESRLWADKAVGEDNFYLMEVSGRQMIDARHKGNLSRFINSSCHPNCETQKWQDASTGETRVGIFAIQDVEIGAEFTYDYNFAHFGGEGTTSFTCMCGHPLCRGTLDANPERTRNYGRRVEIRWAGEKGGDTGGDKFYPATVLSYHNKTAKYLVHYDGGEKEHVRLEGPKAPEHRWLTSATTTPGEASVAVRELEEEKKKKKEEKKNQKSKPKRKRAKTSGPKRVRKPDPRRVKKVLDETAAAAVEAAAEA